MSATSTGAISRPTRRARRSVGVAAHATKWRGDDRRGAARRGGEAGLLLERLERKVPMFDCTRRIVPRGVHTDPAEQLQFSMAPSLLDWARRADAERAQCRITRATRTSAVSTHRFAQMVARHASSTRRCRRRRTTRPIYAVGARPTPTRPRAMPLPLKRHELTRRVLFIVLDRSRSHQLRGRRGKK